MFCYSAWGGSRGVVLGRGLGCILVTSIDEQFDVFFHAYIHILIDDALLYIYVDLYILSQK